MLTQTLALYEDRSDVTLTTYILSHTPTLLGDKRRPAVIVCPGGAYMNCSDNEAEPVAIRFNAMGYHAFVLRYSTYSGNQPGYFPDSSDLEVNANSVYPAPMLDLGKAFLCIRENADKWLVDTDRIAICGFSAGGHNCAMYAVNWEKPIISGHFGAPPDSFRPAAVILGYSLTDYHLKSGEKPSPSAKLLGEAASIAYFGTKTPSEEQLDMASPVLHVTKNTPPVFLWTTADDELVPAEHTTRMATALAKAGVPFEVHIFEHGLHGLSVSHQSSADSLMQADAKVTKWVELAEAWLLTRFALPLREKPFWYDSVFQ